VQWLFYDNRDYRRDWTLSQITAGGVFLDGTGNIVSTSDVLDAYFTSNRTLPFSQQQIRQIQDTTD